MLTHVDVPAHMHIFPCLQQTLYSSPCSTLLHVLLGTITCSRVFAVEARKDAIAVTAPCKAFPLRASGVFEAKPVAALAGLKSGSRSAPSALEVINTMGVKLVVRLG